MAQFTICYELSGGITIEAETEDQARAQFDDLDMSTLYENAGSPEITLVVEETED